MLEDGLIIAFAGLTSLITKFIKLKIMKTKITMINTGKIVSTKISGVVTHIFAITFIFTAKLFLLGEAI